MTEKWLITVGFEESHEKWSEIIDIHPSEWFSERPSGEIGYSEQDPRGRWVLLFAMPIPEEKQND